MEKEIKINIKTEHIQSLLEGKKLTYDYVGKPRITLIPDRYGVFLTVEKLAELRRRIGIGIMVEPYKFFEEFFGKEMADKIISNN